MVFYQIQDLLRKHRISYPTMLLCIFGQVPVFISLFVATQEARRDGNVFSVIFVVCAIIVLIPLYRTIYTTAPSCVPRALGCKPSLCFKYIMIVIAINLI